MDAKPAGIIGGSHWALEVVRGRDTGRLYTLNGGEIVLGNALGGVPGIDLADQEGTSPRRMAPCQARLECSQAGVTLRDLDSPGGTFVNRQRLRPGQARVLQAGDVIQLGGVQLRLIHHSGASPSSPTPPPPPRPQPATTAAPAGRPPLAFTLKTGPTCRSWDDFLIVSAQRWADLREELTSGRLAAYLASIGRADLAPPPDAPGTPDERLDAWLAALPTTKANQPELDVHPRTLSLRVTPGGGSTRRKVRVANAGHRLLRWSARIEPAGTPWLALAPEFAGKTIPTVEEADLPIDVMIPDRLDRPLSAALVIESNGGTQRVAVSLEPSAPADVIPEAAAPAPVRAGWGWRDPIASLSPRTRIIAGALSLAGLRLAVALLGPLVHPRAEATPDLAVAAFLLAVLGSLGGARLSRLRGTRRDMPSGALTGALLGILVATMYVAACRSIEPLLGKTLSGSALVVVMLWGLIGAGLAALSQRLIPPRTSSEGP